MVMRSDIISEVQVERMLQAASQKPQHRLFLETLYYTGARISEVIGLDTEGYSTPMTPESIFFEEGYTHLRNLKSKKVRRVCNGDRMGKDGTSEKCGQLLKQGQKICLCGSTDIKEVQLGMRFKDVQIPPVYLESLKRYIESNNIQHDQRLFPFSRPTGYRIVRRYARLVGINKIGNKMPHPHNFRHTFVMKMVNDNIDTKAIQQQSGHSSIASLGEYFNITTDIKTQINRMWEKKKWGDTNGSNSKS